MKIYFKYCLILIVIVGGIFLLSHFTTPNTDIQIKDYLIDKGYKESEFENLLIKQESDTKKKSFSLADYTYMIESSSNDIDSSLNATYSFKDETLVYSYRINYNSVNVWFKGSYNNDNFICDKEFSSETLSNNDIDNICNLVNIEVKLFELEAKTLFTKYKYIDYIKNK